MERAIQLAPNDALAHLAMAKMLVFAGRPQDAREFLTSAVRLDTHGAHRQSYIRGLMEFGLDEFDEAAVSVSRALELNARFPKPTAILVAKHGY